MAHNGGMGSAITSVNQMVSIAGELRRDAKTQDSETAAKFHQAARNLETEALARVGATGPLVGKLLDTFV